MFAKLDNNNQQLVWMNYANMSRNVIATIRNNLKRKPKLIPLLISIKAVASAIISVGSAVYSTHNYLKFKAKVAALTIIYCR